MKKIIGIILVLVICVQAVSVLALQRTLTNEYIEENIVIGTPTIIQRSKDYFFIDHEFATSYIMEPGEPLLPKITKVFQIPLNAQLSSVDVVFSNVQSIYLSGIVQPSPKALVDGSNEDPYLDPVPEIYDSSLAYPGMQYTIREIAGLDKTRHVRYISVSCYPVQYYPADNMLSYAEELTLTVSYDLSSEPLQFPDEYDLLIISPEEFVSSLQTSVDHKNGHGVRTYVKTLEEIYATFSTGRDEQEQIKLGIKDAIETKGITYVLLIGGLKGQTHQWYLPVRYGQSPSEAGYISDLYYADIYKIVDDELVFEDWDSNGNGKFAEYGMFAKDIIDGAPDVYVGRLAVRPVKELDIVIDKIITYEREKADDSWFKKMLLIGGDTYPESPGGICEAEIYTNVSASHMTGFTFERIWASLGTLSGQSDVEVAMNKGSGFIHMAGHANPASLVTYPPGDRYKENKIIIMAMYNLYAFPNINPKLNNEDKLPVIVVGGCHNSQFNVTMANILTGIQEYGVKGFFFGPPYKFFYMEWVPKCWSWWLTSKPDGGAIATLGNTGLGMGIHDEGYLTGLNGWLFPRFFYHYGQMGAHQIGMAQGMAIIDYVLEFDINKRGEDRQMVQQWALLGDPSLLPGGYS